MSMEQNGTKMKSERGGTVKKAQKTGPNITNERREFFQTRGDRQNEA